MGRYKGSYEYTQAQQALERLGRSCGYLKTLIFYDLRRTSGKMLNEAYTPEERNQIIGHTSGTSTIYREYYMPEFIGKDVPAVYFGVTPQDDTIQGSGRIPRRLTDDQLDEVN